MRLPNREIVESIRKDYPAGTRVELVRMEDVQAPPIGTKGTVTGVDDTGSIMVDWDNGSGLNVIYGEDVTDEQAMAIESQIQEKYGDKTEITVINGGQPVYYYIISVE